MRFQNAVRVYGRLGRSTRWSVPALLGASLVGGVAWGATDTTINPSVIIPAGAAATPATPTQASATYTFSYVHLGQPATALFTYNFATQSWQAPTGWNQTVGTPAGVSEFTLYDANAGTADKIVITGAPSITNTPTVGSNALSNIGAYVSPTYSVLLGSGSTVTGGSVTGNTNSVTSTFAVNNAGITSVIYTDLALANGSTVLSVAAPTATTGLAPATTPGAVGNLASSVTVTSAQGTGAALTANSVLNGTYTIATNGTVSGSNVSLGTSGLAFNKITGSATGLSGGDLVVTATATPTFSVDAATGNTVVGGTLAVSGATTTAGLSNVGNFSNTGTMTNTGTFTNTGNMVNSGSLTTGSLTTGALTAGALSATSVTTGALTTGSLTATGDATVGGGLSVTGSTTLRGLNNSGYRITGLANGLNATDAANYGQLLDSEKLLSRGIASATALANIPALSEGKSASVGLGVGNYNGHTAVALGANFRVSASSQIRASMATGSSGGKTAVGLGASASW